MSEDIFWGKFGKSRRTGSQEDQYSGWTSTISNAVLDSSSVIEHWESTVLDDGDDDVNVVDDDVNDVVGEIF